MFCYVTHGVTVLSAWRLNLHAAPPSAEAALEIVEGPVPARLETPTTTRACTAAESGLALLDLPGIARILVENGKRIVVEPARRGESASVAAFLLDQAIPCAVAQAGHLVLHASAALVGSAAIAFLGVSGSGKSLLAASLAFAGHSLLCDEAMRVQVSNRSADVYPETPAVKLCPPAASQYLPLDQEPVPTRPGLEKYYVRPPRSPEPSPAPLKRLILLEPVRSGALATVRLTGAMAWKVVRAAVHQPHLLGSWELTRQAAVACSRLANAVPVTRMRVPASLLATPDRVLEGAGVFD